MLLSSFMTFTPLTNAGDWLRDDSADAATSDASAAMPSSDPHQQEWDGRPPAMPTAAPDSLASWPSQAGQSVSFEDGSHSSELRAVPYTGSMSLLPVVQHHVGETVYDVLPTPNNDLLDESMFLSAFSAPPAAGAGASPPSIVPHSPFEPTLSAGSPATGASTSSASQSPYSYYGSADAADPGFDGDAGPDEDNDSGSGSERATMRPSDDNFKERHNASERKRQATINDAITTLRDMLPVKNATGKRFSKGAILQRVVDYMQFLIKTNARLSKENEMYKVEISLLNQKLNALQSGRPAYVAPQPTVGRGITLLAGVLLFGLALSSLSPVHNMLTLHSSDEDGGTQIGRALQAVQDLPLSMMHSPPVAWAVALATSLVLGVRYVWHTLMHLVLVGIVSVLVKVLLEPVAAANSEPVKRAAQLRHTIKEAVRLGDQRAIERVGSQAVEWLGYERLYSSESFLYLFVLLIIELLQHIFLRFKVGQWLTGGIAYWRGAEAFYGEVANAVHVAHVSDVVRDEGTRRPYARLRQLVLVLTSMNAANLAGKPGKHIYAINCMIIAVALRQTLAPRWLTPIVRGLSESYRRQSLWYSLTTEGNESRGALAGYSMSAAMQYGLDGNLREATFAIAQSADLHLASGLVAMWRLSAMLLGGLYCTAGEMLDEAARLLKLVDEFPLTKDERFAHTLPLFQLLLRYRTLEPTREAVQAELQRLDAIPSTPGRQQHLRLVRRAFRGLYLVRLGRIKEALNELTPLKAPRTSVAQLTLLMFIMYDLVTEAYVRLLDHKLHPPADEERVPSDVDIESTFKEWMDDMVEFARTTKAARPLCLRRRGQYLVVVGDYAQAAAAFNRAMLASRSLGWQNNTRQTESDLNALMEHCRRVGVFIGDPRTV